MAVETLFATTLLLGIVLLIRVPVAHAFGPRAAFALWLAPSLRMLMPPTGLPVEVPTMWIETGSAMATVVAAPVATSLPVAATLLSLWAAGALLFLLFHTVEYRRFLARALSDARPLEQHQVEDAAVLVTEAVGGPAAAGLFARRIFVPVDFEQRFAPDERGLALLHEALHHRRGDLWATAAAMLMLALHWFNPVAHLAYRAFRRDLESACDADLLARTGRQARASYARAIVRSAARPMPRAACALTHADEVKGRLKMMNQDIGAVRRIAGGALAIALATSGLALAVPAGAETQAAAPAVEKRDEQVVRRIIVRDGATGAERELSEGERAKLPPCAGEVIDASVDIAATDGKRRSVIKLCGKAGATKADLAAMIDEQVKRLEGDSDLPGDSKAQIVAQLRAKADSLRAGQ